MARSTRKVAAPLSAEEQADLDALKRKLNGEG